MLLLLQNIHRCAANKDDDSRGSGMVWGLKFHMYIMSLLSLKVKKKNHLYLHDVDKITGAVKLCFILLIYCKTSDEYIYL